MLPCGHRGLRSDHMGSISRSRSRHSSGSSPLFILFFTALKSANDFAQNGTFSLPQTIELSNFGKAWNIGIRTYFMNSLVLTLIKVPTGVFICSLAAFALTKMRLRGAQAIFTIFVLGLVVPMQMTLRSLDHIVSALGVDRLVAGAVLPLPRLWTTVGHSDPARLFPLYSR